MSETTDAELVDAYLGRRQDTAFVELVRRYQIPVFRQLELALADPDDAEAVCESVFFVASKRLEEWPRQTAFRDWLLALTTEVGEDRSGAEVDTSAPRFVDPAVFFKHSVHRALHALPDTERKLLVAVDLEGRSVEEAAASVAMPLERVTQALDAARTRFTEAINERPETSEAAAPPAERLTPGEIVDKRYRVEDLLGEGGMASVFRAEHVNIKRKVALKTLHPTRQTEAMMRERFLREAEVLGKLSHPNFVDVSDFGVSRGFSYLVMELLSGRALSAEVARGPMEPRRALSIVREVCVGLEHAHGLGIIHRDIKPANIVVQGDASERGFAKILDLGIAATEGEAELEGNVLYGTPEYMAPEQILAQRIDGRVDLYALGITFFELLTGRVPFTGSSIQFVLAQQLTVEVPKLRDERPDLPEVDALQALLDSCIAKDPEKRVRNAGALRDAADALLLRLGGPVPGVTGPVPSTLPAPRLSSPSPQRSGRGWLLVALAVVLVALGAWLAWRALT